MCVARIFKLNVWILRSLFFTSDGWETGGTGSRHSECAEHQPTRELSEWYRRGYQSRCGCRKLPPGQGNDPHGV